MREGRKPLAPGAKPPISTPERHSREARPHREDLACRGSKGRSPWETRPNATRAERASWETRPTAMRSRINCLKQVAHSRRGVVIGKQALVSRVADGQQRRALRRRMPMLYVLIGVDPLPGAPVEFTTLPFGFAGIHKCRLIFKMKDQPQLETRIRDGEANSVLIRQPDGLLEVRMVLGPLDIEHTPALIDFVITASLDRSLHQDERNSLFRVDFDVDRGVGANIREPLQPIDVVGFRGFAFAEHNNGLAFWTVGGPPPEILRLSSSWRHLS